MISCVGTKKTSPLKGAQSEFLLVVLYGANLLRRR